MATFKEFQGSDFQAFSFSIVQDEQGRSIPISRFWHQQPAILVFLRHFGCVSCRSHSQDVWAHREHLQKNGARIVFIGNGSPDRIEEFRQNYHLEGAPIFTDPTLKSFQLGGFHHGLKYLLSPKSGKNMVQLISEGHSNGNPFSSGTGSNRQMGGIVVVQPGGKVSYHYISEAVGDTPEAESIPDGTGSTPPSHSYS
jgi:peroxiredoxin